MKAPTRWIMAMALALPLGALPAASADPGSRDFAGTVEFAQRLGDSVPAELRFLDERGNAVQLGDYLGTGPLGLVFSYYSCSNLCPTQIRNLAQRLAQTSGAAANHAQMLVVSIDPMDSPALASQAKHRYLDVLLSRERAARWHFLSGAPADIARLTQSLGFRYGYDQATHQYAHPAGFALITPEGKIARYFFGYDYTADELGHAFDQAAIRRISSPIERLLLVCFHYDLASAPYSALIIGVLRAVSIATLLGLLALTSVLIWRAHRRRTMGS
jgi:protein SCO1/2